MSARTQITGGRRKRRKKPKKQAFTVEFKEDDLSIELDKNTIAQALAAEATEALVEGLKNSKRRLKRTTVERRQRANIPHRQFWRREGQLIREAHFKPVAGGAEVVVTRPLNGRQMGMALTDAGLRGKRRQETVREMERKILSKLISKGEAEERKDDADLARLIRRNRKGNV